MKKITPRSRRQTPATRLEAVVGGIRVNIIEIGSPVPPADSESDIKANIIEIG